MTLVGLALAVGLLDDEATVTIENIERHLEDGKTAPDAILDGVRQIIVPALVSLVCICIVFVPMFTPDGAPRYLFVPFAEAVIYAMIASFLLSRTLTPTLASYLLRTHRHGAPGLPFRGIARRFRAAFDRCFGTMVAAYGRTLSMIIHRPRLTISVFLLVSLLTLALLPLLGSNFFPSVDAGQITMHVRVPVGTRIEETSAVFGEVERLVKQALPPGEVDSVIDNIGISNGSIDQIYNNSGLVGVENGDIFVSLRARHTPVATIQKHLREVLPAAFPGVTFSFLPADVTSQILNFGAPSAIDVLVSGPALAQDTEFGTGLQRRLSHVAGIADLRMQQSCANPQINVDIDRSRIASLGLSERDVTNSLSTLLAGSSQTAQAFYLNPQNGVSYPIVAQAPEYRIDSLPKLESVPVSSTAGSGASQVLGALGRITRQTSSSAVTHYNVLPAIDLFASVQGRNLGGVTAAVQTAVASELGHKPKDVRVQVRGQSIVMRTALTELSLGLLAAIAMIYLVLIVNFQSWLDPLIVICTLPTAIGGATWLLFVTSTALSVPALAGFIMCMGIATANSILVVSFARERLQATGDAIAAALQAGSTRMRPVLMTASSMIIGMLPMALGLGEGSEQNAPLGRAVIGGFACATGATLFLIPVVFAAFHHRATRTGRSVARVRTTETVS